MARIEHPVRRGQIYWVNWEPHRGSEQAGRRPSLIVQANEANELDDYGNTIVAALSTSGRSMSEVHVNVDPSPLNNLSRPGYVKCEHLMTISRLRLDGYIGTLEPRYMAAVNTALVDVLGLF